MRKELGKPTRKLFFEKLREIAPDFLPSNRYDLKGCTWTVAQERKPLGQWLWFQSHKHDDAFTVELSWSCETDNPLLAPFGAPGDNFSLKGCRFRLGAFWDRSGDFWWYIRQPPDILTESPEEYIHRLLNPPRVDLQKDLPRLRAAVDDAVKRIQEHALPYFERVAEWATRNG